ncbi:MAG TPA: hypothetical protein VKO42_01720 [Patescibacteria group bacterium]|nr:hypothetical protein [Patescibacteria group bacterium]
MVTVTRFIKKGGAGLLLAVLVLVLSACGPEPVMDQPAEDGNFHYRNQSLGFEVTLPPSFEHYQTQRREKNDYTEIVFLVPTSDTSAFQVVSGYGKPLTVRVYKQKKENYGDFREFAQKDGNYYTVDFWERIPRDWQNQWSEEVQNKIKQSLKLK